MPSWVPESLFPYGSHCGSSFPRRQYCKKVSDQNIHRLAPGSHANLIVFQIKYDCALKVSRYRPHHGSKALGISLASSFLSC